MMYEVYHYIYGDICPDSYYGKEAKRVTIGIFCDTERRIKSFVDKLNEENHSYYAREMPEDEYDCDFVDEDYYSLPSKKQKEKKQDYIDKLSSWLDQIYQD